MTDSGVLARLVRIEQKLDRILTLLTPVTVTYSTAPGADGQVSGGLRDHEGQDAR